jgi:hypothetical protein
MHLIDVIDNTLVVHNDWLCQYISKASVMQNRLRKFTCIDKSYVAYDSVVKAYAKNTEVLSKLPKKEVLLAEIAEREAKNKQQAIVLATISENTLEKDVKALLQQAKKGFYNQDLVFFGQKAENPADLAELANAYSLLADIKGKLAVKALEIKGLESKGQLIDLIYAIGSSAGWIDVKRGWFEVKAGEFREKLAEGREKALLTLVHGNTNNDNAAKLTNNELAKKVLLSLWVNKESDIKHSEAWIVEAYNSIVRGDKQFVDTTTGELISESSNLPTLSEKTIRNFLNLPYNQAIFSKYRHGSKYYKDTFRPYVLGVMPKYSLSMWSLDGSTMPFVRQRSNSKESAFKRFKVVFVFDVATNAIVGYAWGMAEGKKMFVEAINMALRKTLRIPLEIQQDNAARFLEKEFIVGEELKSIFPFVSFPEPYNPQAKPVERLLGMFDEEVLRNQKGWMGKNIKGTKTEDSMRNPDYVPYAYTDEEFESLLPTWVAEWNNNKGRLAKCLSSINPVCQHLTSELLYQFCSIHTKRQIKNGFVSLEYKGKEYTYLVDDYEGVLAQISYNRVRVRFIEEKLNTEIAIYSMVDEENSALDKFICICKEASTVQRAKGEQTAKDKETLANYMERKKSFDKIVEQKNSELLSLSKVVEKDLKEEVMSVEEAEAILQTGYTEKALMEKAEEVIAEKSISKSLKDKLKLYK